MAVKVAALYEMVSTKGKNNKRVVKTGVNKVKWGKPRDQEGRRLWETYCEHDHTQRTDQRATRGRKPETSTPFVPVILKTVKEDGEPFSTFWLVDVERVYMPLNLDNHWVAVEMNLKASRITMLDSLQSTTHSRKMMKKLAPISYVLADVLRSMGKCGIFTLKVIEFLSAGIPLDLIKPQNVPAFRLRMAVDMLHEVQNV
ncbi:hypothetical protein ACFX2A_000222 [Malus domestica]